METANPSQYPFADKKTTRLISDRIDELRLVKSQREIAHELGYERPNIVSMIKRGETKIPLEKAPAMAKALNVDPVHLMRLALDDYMPTLLEVFESIAGHPATDNERTGILEAWREATQDTDPALTAQERSRLAGFLRAIRTDITQMNAGDKREPRRRKPPSSE